MARHTTPHHSMPVHWGVIGALLVVVFLVALFEAATRTLGLFTVPVFIAGSVALIYVGARVIRRRRFRIRAFNELLAMTPSQFEFTVADMLRDLGYRKVDRIGRSGDLAADITCRDKKGRSVVVQCKRYAPGARVGSRDVQSFIGMVKVHHEADLGIFVTTSEFTAPAAELARHHGIMLVDGPMLQQFVGKNGSHSRASLGLDQ